MLLQTLAEKKYDFLFRALDSDSNKTLEYEDMFLFYRITLGARLSNEVVGEITKVAMEKVGEDSGLHNDKGRGGKTRVITYKSFKSFVDGLSLEQKMTVHF